MMTHSRTTANDTPIVSVVIPAYNVQAFIAQAIDSVLNQTLSNLEIIVVDDGSIDNTVKVVEKFSDKRIRFIRKENGGCASARNSGVQVARGTFISFLDADDYWLPNKLQQELKTFDRDPDADLVFSSSFVVDEEGKSLGVSMSDGDRSYSFADILIENPVGNGSSAIMKRKTLDQVGLFDESLPASSDLDMWLRIARIRPDNFVCLPEVLTCYRRRRLQATGNWERMYRAYELILEKARITDPNTVKEVGGYSRCNKYLYHASIAYEADEFDIARMLIGKSTRAAPGKFLLKSKSWWLVLAIASKRFLPMKIHTGFENNYVRARRAFGDRKIRRASKTY